MFRILATVVCRTAALLARGLLSEECARFHADLRVQLQAHSSELRSGMPTLLIQCLVAAEDHRFYLHEGIDPVAIGRCISEAAFRRRVTGASTIEQQLARTLTKRYERSLRRKIRELLLASTIDSVITKTDIPGLYLSIAYMGWRMNGLREACDRLGIQLEAITLRQAASLVARLKYPQPQECSIRRGRQIEGRARYISAKAAELSLRRPELMAEGAKRAAIYS